MGRLVFFALLYGLAPIALLVCAFTLGRGSPRIKKLFILLALLSFGFLFWVFSGLITIRIR